MRKFILIAGFVLASAAAQAGERSLSLSGSDVLATPAPVTKAVDPSKTAEAPQAETTKTDAPKYIERPAAVEPRVETPKAETYKAETPRTETYKAEAPKAVAPKVEQVTTTTATTTEPAKPVKTARAEKPRRKGYWTERRIISELHRHGIYW